MVRKEEELVVVEEIVEVVLISEGPALEFEPEVEEEGEVVDEDVDAIEGLLAEFADVSGAIVLETEVKAGVLDWLRATKVPTPAATTIIDTTTITITPEIARRELFKRKLRPRCLHLILI